MKQTFLLVVVFLTFSLGLAQAQRTAKLAVAQPVPVKPPPQALLHKMVLPAIQPALPQPAQGIRVLFECENYGGFTAGPYTDRTWILHLNDGGAGYQIGVRFRQHQDFSNWPTIQTINELYVKSMAPQDVVNLFVTATAIPQPWVPNQMLGQICDLPSTRLAYNDAAQETDLSYICGPSTLPPVNAQTVAFRDVFSDVKTDITQNHDLFLTW